MSTEVKEPPVQVPPNPETPPPAAPAAIVPPPAGDPKPPADPPAAPVVPPVVPDKYDLKLAQGSPLTDADVTELASYAKTHGFTQAQATALLERTEQRHIQELEKQQTFLKDEVTKWTESIKTDKDLGGDAYAATLQHRKTVLDRFAPEGSEFRKLLTETGFIEHPELNRFFVQIGKAMAEDVPPQTRPAGKPEVDRNDPAARAERMFGGKK